MGSSIMHLVFSTLPFLALFSYFLYVAHERPSNLLEAYENGNNEGDNDLVILPLMDMLHTNLVTLLCWSWLAVYTGIFVRRRRRLMKRYVEESETIQVRGDVFYEKSSNTLCRCISSIAYTDLAYVTYKHPEGNAPDGSVRFVQKKIRTYHPYHRENVSVLILKDLPLSGQPKTDVERDIASFQSEYAIRNRDKITQVVIVCVCWMLFCLAGSLYIIYQIREVSLLGIQFEDEEDEESIDEAWMLFWIYFGIVIPAVAGLGNLLQWVLHRRWILKGGQETGVLTKEVPRVLGLDETDYVAMA